MKDYIKPTLIIESLVPDNSIANGDELEVSAPGNWLNDENDTFYNELF